MFTYRHILYVRLHKVRRRLSEYMPKQSNSNNEQHSQNLESQQHCSTGCGNLQEHILIYNTHVML